VSGKPKGLSCREDALTPQESHMLLMVCSSLTDRFIVYCMVFGGLRVSELKHLKRSWVNLEEGTLTIPTRQYCNCSECRKKRDGIWRPKTKKGARTILIHPLLLPVLEEFFATNEELGLSRVSIWNHVQEAGAESSHFP
jgi:integrase